MAAGRSAGAPEARALVGVGLAALACLLRGATSTLGAQEAPAVRAEPPPPVASIDPTAALDGVVVDAAGRPLTGAVAYADGLGVHDLTTGDGRFALHRLPPGPRRFVVRRVGYRPAAFEIDLPADAVVHIRVTLQPSIVRLGTVVVEGEARSLGLWRSGFYERAANEVQGYFFDPSEVLRRNLASVGALLGEVPGVQLERSNNRLVAFGRDVGAKACPMNVWVDGARAAAGPAPLDELAPGPIVRAVEIYPQASGVPARFYRPENACGTILIWTKGTARDLF